MDILLVVSWFEPHCRRNFSLIESLQACSSLQYDVLSVHLPKSVTLGLYPNDDEVDWNVRLLSNIDILLHQTNDNLSLLIDCQPILGIIEPLIISIKLH